MGESDPASLLRLQSLAIEHGVHAIRGLLLAGGYASVLLQERDGPLTPQQKVYLRAVIENTRKIKDVLASLSRVAECRELHLTRFPLRDLIIDIAGSGRIDGKSWRMADDAQCEVCITADRKKLHDAILEVLTDKVWSGCVSIGIQIGRRCVELTFWGPCAYRADSLASQVQGVESMAIGTDRQPEETLFNCRDMVRQHGGLVSIQYFEPESRQITITLPGVAKTGAANG